MSSEKKQSIWKSEANINDASVYELTVKQVLVNTVS